MLFISPYERGDAFKVKIRAGDVWGTLDESSIDESTSYKLMDSSGHIYLVAGIKVMYKGVGIVWSYISDDCKGHGLEVVRFAKMVFGVLMDSLSLHRIQCTVDATKKDYIRFARVVGFEFESVIKKGAPDGGDFLMFRMVR